MLTQSKIVSVPSALFNSAFEFDLGLDLVSVLKEGKGTQRFADGRQLKACWKADRLAGSGDVIGAEGEPLFSAEYNQKSAHLFVLTQLIGRVPTLSPLSGSSYLGGIYRGLPHGEGEIKWAKEGEFSSYKGAFKLGVFHGYGDLVYRNGDLYKGFFVEGKRETGLGQTGEWVSKAEGVYVGEWKADQFEGEGKYTFLDGGSVSGGWHLGAMVRAGRADRYRIKEGRYTGRLWNGVPDTISDETGEIAIERREAADWVSISGDDYSGHFLNGLFHGLGKMTYANADVYTGPFWEGKRHGKSGALVSRNGESYTGSWMNGMRDGEGVQVSAIRGNYTGLFSKDRFHGSGKYTFLTTIYDGSFKDGVPQGRGTLTIDKKSFDGHFTLVSRGTGDLDFKLLGVWIRFAK